MKNNIITIIDFILDKIVPLFMLILIASIILITTSDISSRLFFSHSLTGAIDMSKYLFIWLIFMGISYGIKTDEHFKITEIVDKFPDKLQMIIKKIITILILVFFSVVLFSSVKFMPIVWSRIDFATEIRMIYFNLSIPVGSFLVIIAQIRILIDLPNDKK